MPLYCAVFVHCCVVMSAISEAFPNFARLPNSIYTPSSSCHIATKKCHSTGVWQVFHNQIIIIVSHLGVLERLPLLLCLVFLLIVKIKGIPSHQKLFSQLILFLVICIWHKYYCLDELRLFGDSVVSYCCHPEIVFPYP